MIQTVTRFDFQDAFLKSDTYKNNFSYDALNALFDYLEEYEDMTGDQIEFDMVALCCEYSEVHKDKIIERAKEYGFELGKNTEGETEANAIDYLRDRTQVIEFDGGIIIATIRS